MVQGCKSVSAYMVHKGTRASACTWYVRVTERPCVHVVHVATLCTKPVRRHCGARAPRTVVCGRCRVRHRNAQRQPTIVDSSQRSTTATAHTGCDRVLELELRQYVQHVSGELSAWREPLGARRGAWGERSRTEGSRPPSHASRDGCACGSIIPSSNDIV